VVPVRLRKGMPGALAEERVAERVHDDERPLNDSPADSAPAISRAVAAARPSRQKIGGPALPHLRGDGSRVDFDAAHASRSSDSSRPCQRSPSRAETAACAAASLTGPDDFAERLARLATGRLLQSTDEFSIMVLDVQFWPSSERSPSGGAARCENARGTKIPSSGTGRELEAARSRGRFEEETWRVRKDGSSSGPT